MNDGPKPHRRWLRFSLRTLFLTITLVCCWLGYHVNWLRERRASQEWIAAHWPLPDIGNQVQGAVIILEPRPSLSWTLRLLGEEPVDSIVVGTDQPSDDYWRQVDRIRALFPEAQVEDWAVQKRVSGKKVSTLLCREAKSASWSVLLQSRRSAELSANLASIHAV